MFVNKVEKALVGSAARRNLHNLLCLPSKASLQISPTWLGSGRKEHKYKMQPGIRSYHRPLTTT